MTEAEMNVCCQCPPIYETEYSPGSERTATIVVLDAVCEATGKDVMDLPVLYEEVDLEGLDRIFRDADESTVFAFSYDDLNVFIRGDGRIRVCDATKQGDVVPVFERPLP